MKKTFTPEDFALVAKSSAQTLIEDIRNKQFVPGSSVSWLSKEPTTTKDAAENLYERLRTLGISSDCGRSLFVSTVSNEAESIEEIPEIISSLILGSDWRANFNANDIDHVAVGEAAFLRSDYRKQNGDK